MGEAAIKAAQAINYESVGTIEFLVINTALLLMEMNNSYPGGTLRNRRRINYDPIKEQDQDRQAKDR